MTRTLGPPWSRFVVRGLLLKSHLNLIHVRPSRLLVFWTLEGLSL